ncbi:DUF922 domain-containing protein [Acuticoccus sp. MNP-M23]|uniref:DUF922 domain-containing protein n=1 Tax=Acuticoccus sp. MNP-M23 TaxID=3072793 RepID=UPI00281536AC|nr:DUF922 domain-containing protein [Acuticoccus sp. MNP-M23]WMS44869.1 DUF922 domain-containing protein [Acuticoccus sp. MNP-M23]
MKISAIVAVALGALALASCTPAPPTDVSVKTYKVSGTTLSTLERSLAIHGPAVPGLKGRAFAAVETSFMHSFDVNKTGASCRYNRNGRVGLRSEVILPEWRQRDRAAPELRVKWDIISQYAVIHEAGHIKISQKYARELESAYKRASAPTCEALEANMVKVANSILVRHGAEQQLFDETDAPRFQAYLRRLGYSSGA